MAVEFFERALIEAHSAGGLRPEEIAEKMGWKVEKVHSALATIYEEEEKFLTGRRTEDVYVDYVLRTKANIQQLEQIISYLKETKQGSALVGAVKAKQDLLDRIIDRGQEFGFIKKTPDTKVVIARLDDSALRELLSSEIETLRSLMGAGHRKLIEVKAPYEELPSAPEFEPFSPRERKPSPVPEPVRTDLPARPIIRRKAVPSRP